MLSCSAGYLRLQSSECYHVEWLTVPFLERSAKPNIGVQAPFTRTNFTTWLFEFLGFCVVPIAGIEDLENIIRVLLAGVIVALAGTYLVGITLHESKFSQLCVQFIVAKIFPVSLLCVTCIMFSFSPCSDTISIIYFVFVDLENIDCAFS